MKGSSPSPHPLIKNPHLEGDPFFFEGGPIGIMLVHGFTATTAEMRPLGEYLHNLGFTVSAPLLLGHNTYPEDINHYTWKDWVSEVEAAYQELAMKSECVFLGGESTGGLLALYLASCHPEAAGILTYAPALKLTLRPIDLVTLYALAPFVPYIKQEDEDDGLAWRGYMAKPLKGVIQLLRLQKATSPRLHKIQTPILIVQGRLDETVHPQVPQMIANAVESNLVEIHWMEHSTHCVALDKELDQVNQITHNFIKKVLDETIRNGTS
jgi:carboxylesterase